MDPGHSFHKLGVLLLCGLALVFVCTVATAQDTQSPGDYFGHEMGADFTLVQWDRIVDYFGHLDETSDRITVRELGTTTDGRPMIFAEISTVETVADLATHRESQRQIADPRLIRNDENRQRLIHDTKIPILVNAQLHSTETAASQMSMELAYDLVTDDSAEVREILERCIILLVPCANPDGQQMVAQWYERSLGTPWEGQGLPWLYQKYAGHDNNRDWFMLNLKETRLTTRVLYEEWFPTIVWDVHQMGGSGPRLFVPPFFDPKNSNVHPVIDQTLLIIGGHMAADLSRKDMKGVVHSAIYDNWWAGGFRTTPYRHNMVGILTEAASVRLASPVFISKSELRGSRRGLPQYRLTTNFPDPWPGGWWRLRDIVEYEKSIAMSLFTLAARYHDMFQRNYIHFGEEAIALGENEPPFAWLVPPDQRDPRSAYEMLERFRATAIEVHEAQEDFVADSVLYPRGTFILYCAQPYRPHLMDMMERQVYPDRVLYPGGPAESPYDMAGWTLPLQMGVRHVKVDAPFEAQTLRLDEIPVPQGRIENPDASTYVVPAGHNDDYRLMNRLYNQGISFSIYTGQDTEMDSDGEEEDDKAEEQTWTLADGREVVPGSLVISIDEETRDRVAQLSEGLSIDITGLADLPEWASGRLREAVRPRMALYQPWTASMDEGWTRLVLDNFEFEYATIHNAEIQAGNLHSRYDCIVVPSVGVQWLLDGRAPDTTAPEFVGGIGDVGVVHLQDFVQDGGTLVLLDASTNLAIERFNLPVENVVAGLETTDFYCPGSILRLNMDTNHPLGFGMPAWYSGYFARSQAFSLNQESAEDDEDEAKVETGREPAKRFPAIAVSRFSDTVLLESGWIRGSELIRDKPAIVEVDYGAGHVELIGISVQRRGQPHGTFRILFNAVQSATL